MGVLDKLASAATAAGKRMAAPDDSTAAELASKNKNIDEYRRATAAPVEDKPVRFAPTPAEKVAPKAKFGDRPGEKRIDTSGMTRALGSYEKGTTHVPKTGHYKLHKGEAVVPAKENPMNPYSKVTEATDKPKKVLHEVRTRKAKSGGWIHEHHHTESMHHPMEEHTSASKDDMLSHMASHMAPEPEAEPNTQSASEAQDAAIGA